MKLSLMWVKCQTYWRLGLTNVCRVFIYRLKCHLNYFQWKMPIKGWSSISPCFSVYKQVASPLKYDCSYADQLIKNRFCYFFHAWFDLSELSPWLHNPYTNKTWDNTHQHWSRLDYFASPGEDIKVIWEQSRFYWAPQLALAYRSTGEKKYLERLNHLVSDWQKNNKPYAGYQWLCAQEASIRLINLLLAYYLLGSQKPTETLLVFVNIHIKRILPTLSYATGQQNNHATSEAAALYIAGLWLTQHSEEKGKGWRWALRGRRLLEKHVKKLVGHDGTFSQYSVNYHRLMLDTLSLCVYFQRRWDSRPFSKNFLNHYNKALRWLSVMVEPELGKAPNWGSNDGALLFKLGNRDYRDFRSSIYLATNLLSNLKLPLLDLLGESDVKNNRRCSHLPESGLFIVRNHYYKLFFRYPYFKFRPGQCDIMHIDLWVNEVNVLIDSGTYSYNPIDASNDLKGTANHNTVQVDDHEQMPRISRFLLGGWPRASARAGKNFIEATYKSYFNYRHTRRIDYIERQIEVTDVIKGARNSINLYWHLGNLNWRVEGNRVFSDLITMEFWVDNQEAQVSLSKAKHSLYYGEALSHTVVIISLPCQPEEKSHTLKSLIGNRS